MAKSNFSEGIKWLSKTAGQGHIGSILTLGEAHYYGDGVAKDAVKAYRYFHIASHFGRGADDEAASVAQKNKDVLSKKLSEEDKKKAEFQAIGFRFEGKMRRRSLE
jgi:TPR repeat protein